MIVQGFLKWLTEPGRRNAPNQSEVARKSRISQSWINKAILGGFTRFPDAEVCHKLFSAYPDEWTAYLRSHPAAAKEVRAVFDWALVTTQPARPAGVSPELEQALAYLQTIFTAPGVANVIMLQLKAQADHVAGFSAEPPASLVAPKRRRPASRSTARRAAR